MACVALGCKSRMGVISENNTRLSFHRFPKDPNLRAKWIKNLKRNDWTTSKFSRLCSLHFDDTLYRIGYQAKTLRSDAVPTIFPDISPHPVKKSLKLSEPSRPELPGPSTINNSNQNNIVNLKSIFSKQKMVISKLQQRLVHHKFISIKRAKALKCMRQKNYRTTKELADSQNIINDLRTKLKMDEEKIELLATMPEYNNDLLKRYALKLNNISVEREYSTELKKFAVTLNFISPEAYEYVRQNFARALPHVKTISRWYRLHCGPRFIQEAIYDK